MCGKDYVWKYSTGDSELTCDETIDAVAKLNKVEQLIKFQ